MCGKCNLLAYELDQTADGLAATTEYVRALEAERDAMLLHIEELDARISYLVSDRNRVRDELARVRARVLEQQMGIRR